MSRESLGKFIREQRTVSQRALAKKIGVQATYLSDVERGQRSVTLDMMERIAVALVLLCDKEPVELYDLMMDHGEYLTVERETLLALQYAPLNAELLELIKDALYGGLYERIEFEKEK